MLTKVASAENTKAENSVAGQLQQGCTPQPRPEEVCLGWFLMIAIKILMEIAPEQVLW
jgi:hypothetical protein